MLHNIVSRNWETCLPITVFNNFKIFFYKIYISQAMIDKVIVRVGNDARKATQDLLDSLTQFEMYSSLSHRSQHV